MLIICNNLDNLKHIEIKKNIIPDDNFNDTDKKNNQSNIRTSSGRKIFKKLQQNITEKARAHIEKEDIRDINPTALSVITISIIFQSVVLWKVYNEGSDLENNDFTDDILDIIMNGITA